MLMVCNRHGMRGRRRASASATASAICYARNGLEKDFLVVPTRLQRFCAAGPIVVVQPRARFYQKVRKATCRRSSTRT